MSRRASAASLAVVTACAGATAGTADAAARKHCYEPPRKGMTHTTEVKNRYVRVYRRAPKEEGFEATYLACWRRTGEVFKLGVDSVGIGLSGFRLAGRFVGFEDSSFSRGTTDIELDVVVADVRKRRFVRRWSYIYFSFTDRTVPLDVHRFILRRNGAVAILIGHFSDPADYGPTYEVRAADAAGGRVLDRSPDIVPSSLRRGPHSLTWMHGAEERSAAFD